MPARLGLGLTTVVVSSRTCSPSCWPSRQPRAQQCRPSRCVLRRTRCRCGLPLPPFCNHLAAAHFPRHSRSQVVGLGLWKVPRETTADAVVDAIKAGYRHFDCACDYGNEAEARLRPVALCSSSSGAAPSTGSNPATTPFRYRNDCDPISMHEHHKRRAAVVGQTFYHPCQCLCVCVCVCV